MLLKERRNAIRRLVHGISKVKESVKNVTSTTVARFAQPTVKSLFATNPYPPICAAELVGVQPGRYKRSDMAECMRAGGLSRAVAESLLTTRSLPPAEVRHDPGLAHGSCSRHAERGCNTRCSLPLQAPKSVLCPRPRHLSALSRALSSESLSEEEAVVPTNRCATGSSSSNLAWKGCVLSTACDHGQEWCFADPTTPQTWTQVLLS